MELRDLSQALRKWWYIVAIVTVVSAAVAGGLTAMQPAMYTATAQGMVSVSDPQNRPPYALSSGAQFILDRMTSYAGLGVTTPVLTPVVDELDLNETPLSLSGRVKSQSLVGMSVIEVRVTYNDPQTAAAIADRTVNQTSRAIGVLENGNIQMTAIGAAAVPTQPSNRKVVVNTAVGAAGGLVLGCLIAVGLHLVAGYRRRRKSSAMN